MTEQTPAGEPADAQQGASGPGPGEAATSRQTAQAGDRDQAEGDRALQD